MFEFRTVLSVVAASSLAGSLGGLAHGQTSETSETAVLRVAPVTVTAQKREETEFEVPITLSAITGERLDALRVQNFDQLGELTPGLNVQIISPNNPSFVIRGISSENGNFQDPSRVSVYFNGVDVSRSRGASFELFDLERIETVKGPQATLFGTAALVGAVSVITARPEEGFNGEVRASYGNFNALELGGFVNAGNEQVQGRLAVKYKVRDGYVDNRGGSAGSQAFAGADDLNGVETLAIRPSIRFTPNNRFTADLIYNYESNTPPGTAFVSAVIPSGGSTDPFRDPDVGGPFGNPLLQFTGIGPTGPGFLPIGDTEIAAHLGDDELGLDRKVHDINISATYELNDAVSLFGLAAYREFDSLELFDVDGSQVPLFEFAEDTEGEQFNFEARLSFDNGGTLKGFIGANYFDEEGSQALRFAFDETIFAACVAATPFGQPILAPTCINPDGSFNRVNLDPMTSAFAPLIPAALGPGIALLGNTSNFGDHDSLSLFADATYTPLPALDLTAGIRFIDETRESGISTVVPNSPLLLLQSLAVDPTNPVMQPILAGFTDTGGAVSSISDSFDAFLPRFNALYRINDEANVYATISRGRRSPTLSITESDPFTPSFIDEEIVWNYEAGFKAFFANGRARLDGAVFFQDYEDFRVTIVDVIAGGVNAVSAGKATNIGVELEGEFALTEALSVVAGFAYIDGEIDDDAENGLLAGNRFPLQPETSGSIVVDYRDTLASGTGFGGVDGFVTASWTYRSDIFFQADNAQIAGIDITEDDVSLFGVRAGVDLTDFDFSVSVFGSNIFDEEYNVDGGGIGAVFGTPTFIPGPPALYGIEVSKRF
ncbi:MAG: TonB-dependent receptor [Pseudomonadota bacterium]